MTEKKSGTLGGWVCGDMLEGLRMVVDAGCAFEAVTDGGRETALVMTVYACGFASGAEMLEEIARTGRAYSADEVFLTAVNSILSTVRAMSGEEARDE